METIGKRIQSLRNKNKMSQEELGEKLNVTRQAISNWENGKTQPNLQIIHEIAKIFDIDIQEFFDKDNVKKNSREGSSQLILFFLCIISFFVHFLFGLIGKCKLAGVLFAPGIGLSLCLIIYFVFTNSIKNNDFSMIAGYDKKRDYNVDVLKKVLLNIRMFMLLLTLILNILYSIIYIVDISIQLPVSIIFLFAYILSIIGIVMIVNLKYKKDINR